MITRDVIEMHGRPHYIKILKGTVYSAETDDKVIILLERARERGARIRLFYGDPLTGRDWMEEFGTIGVVSRTTGDVKTPLLLRNSTSISGLNIMDNNIVRITADKEDIYRHPRYHQQILRPETCHVLDEFDGILKGAVIGNYPGEEPGIVTRLETLEKAFRWKDYMLGLRNNK